jgi:conjugal transfer pilus assembly protein TraK
MRLLILTILFVSFGNQAVADGTELSFGAEKSAELPSPAKHKHLSAATKKPTYDPLDVDQSILLKDTPAKEIVLPGVLRIDGESVQALDPGKSHRIYWGNQGIQAILLSLTGPDLIITPFNDPYITGNTYLNIKKRPNSNNIYVSFNFPDGVKPTPVTIFIEDPAGGPALGLQLVPKRIAQQVYTIVDETQRSANGVDQRITKGADYATHIQELMQIVAQSGTPSGYSSAPYDLPPIIIHGIKLDVVRRLSNTEGDIYSYVASNPTTKTVMLDEREFDGPLVKAVSIFPKPELRPKEKTHIIVFTQKPERK